MKPVDAIANTYDTDLQNRDNRGSETKTQPHDRHQLQGPGFRRYPPEN